MLAMSSLVAEFALSAGVPYPTYRVLRRILEMK
jgi:hypothetical protein